MQNLIYLFLIIAVVLILLGLTNKDGGQVKGVKLEQQIDPKELKKVKMRALLARLFPFTPQLLERLNLEAKLKKNLEAGHLRLSTQEFFNLKLLVGAGLALLSFLILGKFEPLLLLISAFFGFSLLDFLLKQRIAQRKERIVKVLPETVDLLGLCVEAGLDFVTAVKWVVDKIPSNPFIEELDFVLEEIRWGKPRLEALRDMSQRLNITEVSSFVQTLVQSERMGTPVTEAFVILSEDTRMQRFHRGERQAIQAPMKILIPLIFCILPVIAIIIGAPILLQFMQGKLF